MCLYCSVIEFMPDSLDGASRQKGNRDDASMHS